MAQANPSHRDAWVEVDLGAVVENALALQRCAPNATTIAVVKANAYGHGAVPVSWALADAGFEAFAVATIDEGIELRQAGIPGRVIVLYESPLGALGDAVAADLELTLGTPESLGAALALREDERRRLRAQLKLDTGMTRQGLRVDRLGDLAEPLRRLGGSVAGVWTHLADGADTSADEQLAAFDAAVDALRSLGIEAPRHVAASAAILSGRGIRYEAVRPGLSLYGVAPAEFEATGRSMPIELKPSMAVYARAIRVETVPPGARVGYSGTFEAQRPTQLALLPLGYADGMRRNLGNGVNAALYGGARLPIVGRVSMDSCTADATDAPVEVTRDGIWTIVGRDGEASITIEELARIGRTVPQEILLGFDDRLPFVYVPHRPARA